MQLVNHEAKKIPQNCCPRVLVWAHPPDREFQSCLVKEKEKKTLCLWSQTVPRVPSEIGAEAESLETYWWKPGNKADSSHTEGVSMQEDVSRGDLSGDPDPAISWVVPRPPWPSRLWPLGPLLASEPVPPVGCAHCSCLHWLPRQQAEQGQATSQMGFHSHSELPFWHEAI